MKTSGPDKTLFDYDLWDPSKAMWPGLEQELVGALREALKQRDDVLACLEHAQELGYLGEGSTAGWAKDLIQKYGEAP